jgi:hypothetical protein
MDEELYPVAESFEGNFLMTYDNDDRWYPTDVLQPGWYELVRSRQTHSSKSPKTP